MGESEEDSPNKDHESDDGDDGEDSEGIAAHLDRILDDLPRSDVETSRMGASKGPLGGPRDGRQKEASWHRSCADTPTAPTQGRAIPQPQPLSASGLGHRVKTMATGPLTRGRGTVAASS